MWERRGLYWVLVEKPVGKRLLVRPSCKWEDDIKMDTKKIGWKCAEWVYLVHDFDKF